MRFLFDCAVFTNEALGAIRLQKAEISEHRFEYPADATELLSAPVGRRVTAAITATGCVYLEDGRPVPAVEIASQLPPQAGTPVGELPDGLLGWGVIGAAIQPARASRTLSGILVADGRVLIATITSDDLDWARGIWLSIRSHRSSPRRPARPVREPAATRPN
jgi:hypothetical protein